MFKLNQKNKTTKRFDRSNYGELKQTLLFFLYLLFFCLRRIQNSTSNFIKKNKMSTKKILLNDKSPSDGNF